MATFAAEKSAPIYYWAPCAQNVLFTQLFRTASIHSVRLNALAIVSRIQKFQKSENLQNPNFEFQKFHKFKKFQKSQNLKNQINGAAAAEKSK